MSNPSPKQIYDERLGTGDLSADEGQAAVIEALDHLYQKLLASHSPSSLWQKFTAKKQPLTGLYLYGGVGRGKSMLMDMFYESLPDGLASRVHFHDFMVLAHDKMNEARKAGAKDPVSETAKALGKNLHCLCFDEMEVRDIADAMIVKRLFDGLFAQDIVIVATSNRHPDDLYQNGLHRDRFLPFIAKLKHQCDMIEIAQGADWRSRLLGKTPRWYVPCDDINLAKMKAQFDIVTNQTPPMTLIVKVAGRELIFDKVAHNIAYASFDELCAVPLAARDYVAIADRLTGLFLTDIPKLGDDLQNEARRFMWLIDALYDRGRFIVASAEADMSALYHGQQWAFEFDRTLSRLSEMSRISYHANQR